MRTLCAQAGYGLDETSADEDVRAIDGTINFHVGSCHFQVKCTTREFTAKKRIISWPINDGWTGSWKRAMAPVYFVLVKVTMQQLWAEHLDDSTVLNATAYWERIDPDTKRRSIIVPERQRFTTSTLQHWARDRQDEFEARAS